MGSAPAEGSDAAIYPELARVNLLRMRGDFKSAVDHCRSILRRFPNNVSANQLLGDLNQEMGDLQQAKEWYELALDIAPADAQIQRKLRDIGERLEREETAGIVDRLGLPPDRSKTGWLAAGLAACVIVVGIIAYLVGSKQPLKSSAPPQVSSISAPAMSAPSASTSPSSGSVDTTNPSPATPLVRETSEETTLSQTISQQSANGGRLLGIGIDPRSSQLTLTFRMDPGEDMRIIGVELAGIALDNHSGTRIVTLRALETGVLKYMADVRREAYEETKSETWKQANSGDPLALTRHLLTNEWPTAPEPPTEQDSTVAPATGEQNRDPASP